MTLKDWLAEHKMSDAEFARLSGIGQRALIQKYRHGRQFPAPENLRRIREATKGVVTADDFVDQHAGESAPFQRPEPPAAPTHKGKRSRSAAADIPTSSAEAA